MSDTSTFIVSVTEANINDVLQKSVETPVLLDFWADWCEPCKALAPILDKVATDYAGKFILAKIDADACQGITQQLGVKSLPTLKLVVQGKLVDELSGAQSESDILALLEKHVGAVEPDDGADPFLEQIQRARKMGANDQALAALQAAIAEQPERWEYHGALVEVLIDENRIDEAKDVAAKIGDETLKKAALVRLAFVDWLADAPAPDVLQQRLDESPQDIEARYYLGLHLTMAGHYDAGLDMLFSVMQADRQFKDDAARLALLKAFDLIGTGHPAVTQYRRKLFTLLH